MPNVLSARWWWKTICANVCDFVAVYLVLFGISVMFALFLSFAPAGMRASVLNAIKAGVTFLTHLPL